MPTFTPTLLPISSMTEAYLCNTISCSSVHITDDRKDECRKELLRRYRSQFAKKATSTSESILQEFEL